MIKQEDNNSKDCEVIQKSEQENDNIDKDSISKSEKQVEENIYQASSSIILKNPDEPEINNEDNQQLLLQNNDTQKQVTHKEKKLNHYKALLTAIGYGSELQKELKDIQVSRKARSLLKSFPQMEDIYIFTKQEKKTRKRQKKKRIQQKKETEESEKIDKSISCQNETDSISDIVENNFSIKDSNKSESDQIVQNFQKQPKSNIIIQGDREKTKIRIELNEIRKKFFKNDKND